VWIAPDGAFVVLDEDELEELVARWPQVEEMAERGRAELIALVQSGPLPRWP
jgi:hypothetical protein